jgi:hypothetical protein
MSWKYLFFQKGKYPLNKKACGNMPQAFIYLFTF